MRLIDPYTRAVVWDGADPNAGPVPPAPEGRSWLMENDGPTQTPTPQARGIDYYLGGTGLPNKLAFLNQTFNPVEAIGQSMQASQRMFAPDRTGWERATDAGNVLSGVAGVVAPGVAASRAGMPAVNALAETFTGLSSGPSANALAGFARSEAGGMPTPFGGQRSVSQAIADDILTMLKSGRGSEVTDEMMAAADPETLFRGYDMPMDAASRAARAQEMGFDTQTPLYHGTGADFRSFEPSSRTGNIGSYFAKDPGIMPDYFARDMMHGGYRDGGNIVQAVVRSPAPLDITKRGAFVGDENTNQFMRDMGLTPSDLTGTGLRGDDNMFELVENPEVAEKLREKWTSIDFMDSFDGGPEWNRAVTDPRNIRSRFARFDPRLAHLKNLSAGIAGGVMLPYLDPYGTEPE